MAREVFYTESQLQRGRRTVLTLMAVLLSVAALVGLIATIPGVGDTFLPRGLVFLDFATVWYLPMTPAFLTGFLTFYYATALGAQALLIYYILAMLFGLFQAVSAWYSAFSPAHSSGFAVDIFNVVVATVAGAVSVAVVVLAWIIMEKQRAAGDLRPREGRPPSRVETEAAEPEEEDARTTELQLLQRRRTQF